MNGTGAGWRLGRRRALAAAVGAGLLRPGRSRAAGALPPRPIRLLVGFAPGGAVDLVARAVADAAGRALDRTVLVENRTGASGNIASAAAAAAAADGTTLLLANGAQLAINPALFSLAFDPARAFAPIGGAATVRFVAAVPASSAARDLPGFVALTRDRPASYGSSGVGSVQHLGAELFKAASGAAMTHVPYRGSGPMMTDLLGSRIDFTIDAESVLAPAAQAGGVRVLAVMGPQRALALPGVPTAAEAGFGDLDIEGWQGLVAPAATPGVALDALRGGLRDALADPGLGERLRAALIVPAYRDADGFAAFVAAERARWGGIVARLGLRL